MKKEEILKEIELVRRQRYLRAIVKNIKFLEPDDYPYNPKLVAILSDQDAEYTMELHNHYPNPWFRIIRIKNGRRTHDFIINTFENNHIVLENEKSQSCTMYFEDVTLIKELFNYALIYPKYDRKRMSPADHYTVKGKGMKIAQVLKKANIR